MPRRNFCHQDKANTLPAIAGEPRRFGDERPTAALLLQVVQHAAAALHRPIEHVEFHIDCGLVRCLHDGRCFVYMHRPPGFELDQGGALH